MGKQGIELPLVAGEFRVFGGRGDFAVDFEWNAVGRHEAFRMEAGVCEAASTAGTKESWWAPSEMPSGESHARRRDGSRGFSALHVVAGNCRELGLFELKITTMSSGASPRARAGEHPGKNGSRHHACHVPLNPLHRCSCSLASPPPGSPPPRPLPLTGRTRKKFGGVGGRWL